MNMEETIYKRQSTRNYKKTPLDAQTIEEIENFIEQTKRLKPDIEYAYDIVDKTQIKTILPWRAPQYLLIYSQEKENYKENVGFIFQQLDLYLQSSNVATCWLGLVKPKQKHHENMKYTIAMAMGKAKTQTHRKPDKFKRKALTQITDIPDEKLKPIQYAPSATNSQPWYITHNTNGTYNIYRKKQDIIRKNMLGRWNRIDIGIGLAHIYVSNKETFSFWTDENPEELRKHIYEGTFRI